MRKYDAVLFDFDGTLYDTFPGIAKTLQHVLHEHYGREKQEDLDYFKLSIGPPLEWSFHDRFGLSDEDTQEAMKTFRAHYREACIEGSELYEGMDDALRRLESAGVALAIASSKPNEMICRILDADAMTETFKIISGLRSPDDHASKTVCIERALEALGVPESMPKHRVLMVGDRYYDAEGAQNAGLDFCAALYAGFHSDGEFDPYPSVCSVKSPEEIADFVLGAEETVKSEE